MANNRGVFDCFSEFDTAPKKKEPSIQLLYDYEKHYMELVRKYSDEIRMISDMLREFRQEQVNFYGETLPKISEKLKQDEAIDEEIRTIWLNRFTANMDRSFALSESLINEYTTKKIDEFKAAVQEKLQELG